MFKVRKLLKEVKNDHKQKVKMFMKITGSQKRLQKCHECHDPGYNLKFSNKLDKANIGE